MACATPFLQLLATHPPLEERIRRIDPSFDGRFPDGDLRSITRPTTLVDPHTLARRRGTPLRRHACRGRGRRRGLRPAIPGRPSPEWANRDREHIEYASAVVGSLPLEVASAVRDPLGAVATVYALLLDDEETDVRRMQLDYLAAQADPKAEAETRRVAPFVGQFAPKPSCRWWPWRCPHSRAFRRGSARPSATTSCS